MAWLVTARYRRISLIYPVYLKYDIHDFHSWNSSRFELNRSHILEEVHDHPSTFSTSVTLHHQLRALGVVDNQPNTFSTNVTLHQQQRKKSDMIMKSR